MFDTPQTLTHFANANVLTSNMFQLVGRAPRTVPADRRDDVEATAQQLDAEIDAVDDDAVRAALAEVRAPFADALDGDLHSDGLQQPLEKLGAACGDAGYDAGTGPAGPDDMELLTDGKTLLVTSRWAGKVTEIDTTTRKVVRQVKVGKSPHGIWTLDHKPRL